MKRSVVAGVAGVVAAVVVALTAGSGSGSPAGLGAAWAATGQATVGGRCDRDGLATTLRTAFEPGLGYQVVAVAVDGIDAHCAGRHLSVALTDGSGKPLAQGGPVLVPAGGGALTVTIPPVAVLAAGRVHTLLD